MALNNVPLNGQSLAYTKPLVNANFSTIDTTFSVDHVAYNTSGGGKHNKVTFPVQGSAPAFAAGDNGLYSFLYATTAKNEEFIHKQTFAGTSDIPFTASILSTATPALNTGGWSYLPSGLLLKFGNGSANGSTNFTFAALNPGAPGFTQVLTMVLCPGYTAVSDGDGFVRLGAYTSAGFNAFGSARTTVTTKAVTFQYIAIGY